MIHIPIILEKKTIKKIIRNSNPYYNDSVDCFKYLFDNKLIKYKYVDIEDMYINDSINIYKYYVPSFETDDYSIIETIQYNSYKLFEYLFKFNIDYYHNNPNKVSDLLYIAICYDALPIFKFLFEVNKSLNFIENYDYKNAPKITQYLYINKYLSYSDIQKILKYMIKSNQFYKPILEFSINNNLYSEKELILIILDINNMDLIYDMFINNNVLDIIRNPSDSYILDFIIFNNKVLVLDYIRIYKIAHYKEYIRIKTNQNDQNILQLLPNK